jgi:hypothetical protein
MQDTSQSASHAFESSDTSQDPLAATEVVPPTPRAVSCTPHVPFLKHARCLPGCGRTPVRCVHTVGGCLQMQWGSSAAHHHSPHCNSSSSSSSSSSTPQHRPAVIRRSRHGWSLVHVVAACGQTLLPAKPLLPAVSPSVRPA